MKQKKQKQIRVGRNESVAIVKAHGCFDPNATRDVGLPDGNPDAIRCYVWEDSGEPVLMRDGGAKICCPWLLCGIFSI